MNTARSSHRKYGMRTLAAAAISGTALVISASSGIASDSETDIEPDEQAQEAIDAWQSASTDSTSESLPTSTGAASTEAVTSSGTSYRTTENYRGSFLMWANERVDFGFNGTSVVSSSGYQESGAVFPNNVTRNGTERISANSTLHQWRGSYTVGAGVPTPWGDANVYNSTDSIRTDVRNTGAWQSWWV